MGTNKANAVKSAQLGMSFGAACHRLRKLVMFDLLVRHEENICYRCAEPIQTPDELSIEHKEAWQDVSVNLFWDIQNIAFSHLTCNVAAGRKVGKWEPGREPHNKKSGPAGTAWCSGHKSFLPTAEFSRNEHAARGLEAYCKKCRSERRSPDNVWDELRPRHPRGDGGRFTQRPKS